MRCSSTRDSVAIKKIIIIFAEKYTFYHPQIINAMKKKTLLLTMLMGIAGVMVAQNIPSSIIEVNNVRGNILGTGNVFSNVLSNNLTWEVPKDSGNSTLFQYSLWIGGVDENDSLHLAANKYNQAGRDYWMGPLAPGLGTIDDATEQQFEHIWNLTRSQIDEFISNHGQAGYEIPEDILTWPAHGPQGYAENLAPFVDVNGDEHYNPADGDYPDIMGDQCLFFIFNDSYANHTESSGGKLGLEVHAMVYAYDAPDDEALNNTVFFHYELFNRSSNTYFGTYVGVWNDWDIGDGWNDFAGCNVRLGSFYGYNATSDDNVYGTNLPVQACTILGGPFFDADGIDNLGYNGDCESSNASFAYSTVNFDNGIIDDERFGLSRYMVQSNSNDAAMGDPTDAIGFYNVLRGLWANGTKPQYGGNGFSGADVVGPNCNFLFPGDSDPCNYGTSGVLPNGGYNVDGHYWTEEGEGNPYSDRRGLGITGPFTFQPSDMQPLDFAMTTVWASDRTSALDRLEEIVSQVITKYIDDYNLAAIDEYPEQGESLLKVYPNPSEGVVMIEGTGKLTIVNALGQQVLTRDIDGQTTLSLPSGLYLIQMQNEKGAYVNKLVVK
jgi:hypothetical protein